LQVGQTLLSAKADLAARQEYLTHQVRFPRGLQVAQTLLSAKADLAAGQEYLAHQVTLPGKS
jgi:hypothetical protein